MLFSLTAEQQQVREAVRAFANERVRPGAAARDRAAVCDLDLIREVGALGFIGVTVSPEFGGAGMDWVSAALVMEELARADASLGLSLAGYGLAVSHLALRGTDELKRRFLPDLIAARKIGAWAMTEPNAGSDSAAIETTATRDGDHWRLGGEKTFTTMGTHADVYVAMAVTTPEAGTKGITAFLVERGIDGVIPGQPMHKLGCRSSDTSGVVFDQARVPVANVLGEVDAGFRDAMLALNRGRTMVGAFSVGVAQSAFQEALRYAQERRSMGHRLADHQAIQHKLAEMAVSLDAARLLVYRAAALLDDGQEPRREAASAKLFASETAVRVAYEALQIHGGYGYTSEFPIERIYRDARVCTIGEGTSEIMRMVIARDMLRNAP